uniref:Uncharacterized protein n=1 Tax=Pundamilia nyererei TaxID=303518 RepID=A0A3B4G6L7_9CICH
MCCQKTEEFPICCWECLVFPETLSSSVIHIRSFPDWSHVEQKRWFVVNLHVYLPTNTNERALPQWLTGIIAVCGFLFLAFVVILAKKAWCENPSRSVGQIPPKDRLNVSVQKRYIL